MRKVALVTGGSRGIGLAIVKKLCENGYDVAVNGVRAEEQVRDTLDELNSGEAKVIYCRGDVGVRSDREKVLAEVKSEFGSLNVLVNNAGVGPKDRLDILEATEESFDWVMDINLKGPYFLTQAVARWMIEQKKESSAFTGSIINVGSISATVISTNRGEYCVSKAGFAMHNKLWAVRMAEYDIPVYEVRPGVTRTDMTARVEDKYDRLIKEGLTAQPRWGKAEDLGKAVFALADGNFPYSTGDVYMVDGGLTMQRL